MTTAVIIFRDRVTYARECVTRLAAAGLDIHIVDHGSTWPEAVDWLDTCGLPVWRRPNSHPQTLWDWDGLARIVGPTRRYVVTDPDTPPADVCPDGWPAKLGELLDAHPDKVKAGLGLRVDDLPDHYRHRDAVQAWEAQHWANPIGAGVYGAAVDTTVALYQPLRDYPRFALGPALRTGYPYVARHLSWYQDSARPTVEDVYYAGHCHPDYSHWADPTRYR